MTSTQLQLEPSRAARHAGGHDAQRVIVVGGGISGLAAGYLLRRARPELEVLVLERDARAGGLAHSERTSEGLLWERGPDSLATFKPQAMALVGELGLEPELIAGGAAPRRAFVQLSGGLVPLPASLQGALPATIRDVLGSPLLSTWDKLRVACEPFIPRRAESEDESVGQFVTRRFGGRVLDRLVAPLIGGIYACEASALSAQAALSPYVAYERRLGSVGRGIAGARTERRVAHGKPAFVSFRDGMGTLPERLGRELGPALRLGASAAAIARLGDGRLHVTLERGDELTADAVVLACPPRAAATLVSQVAPDVAAELAAIESSDVLHVSLAYRRDAVRGAPSGTGFVVPPSVPGPLSACTFTSDKWSARGPDSLASFRCFLRDPQLSDERAVAQATAALQAALAIEGAPERAHVVRLRAALPRYTVGHLDRVARISARLAHAPGLALAGNAYLGLGIADCIRSAQLAVESILQTRAFSAILPL